MNFEQYLIQVGIRSLEYSYTDEELHSSIPHFKDCWKHGISPYKALLYLQVSHGNINYETAPKY